MACSLAVFPAFASFAPAPDFRYVGLEPICAPRLGVAATAFGLGAGVTLAMSGLEPRQALFAGALASIMSAFALRGAGAAPTHTAGSARMAIVPWGVLIETDETPRILRWAAVQKIQIETSRARARHLLAGAGVSTRVAIETDHDRFLGEAVGVLPLERLVEHLAAYTSEQSTPIALDLHVNEAATPLEAIEPGCEMLLAKVSDWLGTAGAVVHLGLAPAGYRKACALAPTTRAIDVLRKILCDRTPQPADPRAFAAAVAAEIHARELLPELVALTQCPHPIVAAVARQAARKLGASRAKTGTLDEVAPFLFDADRARLEAWACASA
jgi:hypothetical protein